MPILDSRSMEFISRSAEQTRRAGMRLGALLQPGDLICLVGDLGAGKTTLMQGIAAGWGSLDPVSSPTFVLVNVYRRSATRQYTAGQRPLSSQPAPGQRLFHLDAYRLSGPAEAEDLDLDLMLAAGPMVIEWADRVRPALPDDYLWVTLHWVDDEQRDLLISAHGRRYQELLVDFRRQVFGVS